MIRTGHMKNLHRRHLSESQRAMVADKLATMKQHENQYTLKSGHANQRDHTPVTQKQAANLLNVGRRTVQTARKVSTHGVDGLADLVTAGEVSVEAAAKVADFSGAVPEEVDDERQVIRFPGT